MTNRQTDRNRRITPGILVAILLSVAAMPAAEEPAAIDAATVKRWSAPYRGWHHHPDHVIPAKPEIKGFGDVKMTDVPTVYQLPGGGNWYMTFIGFDGKGYQSFVAESDDLVNWTDMRLAMGYGPEGSYFNFYNAAGGHIEQLGLARSRDLREWKRHAANPVIPNGPKGSYNEKFSSDGKVFRDKDHWVCFFFGVGKGGAHIMTAFSRDLHHWTVDPEPIYKAGGNPSGLDRKYAHKISLVWNPGNETYYMFYNAVGNKGRGIGLITSKPLGR
jgi:predicted GH43/DUF377 family glycosyl hydrolase